MDLRVGATGLAHTFPGNTQGGPGNLKVTKSQATSNVCLPHDVNEENIEKQKSRGLKLVCYYSVAM